eukprot:SAG11_NODE_18005_length_502_cov_1.277916_1_plen_103_part_10
MFLQAATLCTCHGAEPLSGHCASAHDAVLQARRYMADAPPDVFAGAGEPSGHQLRLLRRQAEAERVWTHVRSGQCAEPVVCCVGASHSPELPAVAPMPTAGAT